MATAEIYYFSGTGNSLSVARMIAEKLDAQLIPVASFTNEGQIQSNADVIGITFPVYYADAPAIVCRFARRLSANSDAFFSALPRTEGPPSQR